MKNQRGVTLIGMLMAAIVIVVVAIGGLKVAPAYIEYFTVKKAIVAIAQANSKATVAEVRTAFDRRSAIDNIDVIGPKDLEITKEGNDIVISFSYPKRIPLFGNISLVIDFAASSNN
jgi:Tfp pilus assembly major pilin PilA